MKLGKWIKVENGVITDVHWSSVPQPGMIEVPFYSDVKKGEPVAWYRNWFRIPNDELVRLGIRENNKGQYWNKKDHRESLTVNLLDEKVPEGFTRQRPLEGEPDQRWDGKSWVVDIEKKRIKEFDHEIDVAQSYLDNTDYKVIKAMETGDVVDETLKNKRQEARSQINKIRDDKAKLEKALTQR